MKRRPHKLGKTKQTAIPANLIFFDSESRVNIEISPEEINQILSGNVVLKEHDTFLICACFIRGDRREKWKDYHEGDFMLEFWKDVDKFSQEGQTTYLYAHNAKYDILAIRGIPLLIDMGYSVTSFAESNPLIIEFVKEGKRPKKILVLSTTNYFNNSLKELGKTVGLEKLEAAFNDTLGNAIIYCRRDVEIIIKAMQIFFEFVKENKIGNIGQTLASQAFNAYRSRFMTHEIFIHCDEKAIEIERESYSGGRTEVWKMGNHKEKLYYLDVNSMYPFVMLEENFPVKLVSTRTNADTKKLEWFLDREYLACAEVEIKTKKRIFPVKYKGKLLFPVGSFKTCLSTPELIKAIEENAIKKVHAFSVYESANIFQEYVEFFYHNRLEAKAKGDKVMDYLFKIFLNSLYGKFGQKSIEWEEVGKAEKDIIKIEYIYDKTRGTYKTIKIIGGLVLQNVDRTGLENESFNSFPAIASHVTSYARSLLWDYIQIAEEKNVYYMDTDSIICNLSGYENLQAAGKIQAKTLGLLDLEKEGYFSFYGAKDYEFRETPAAAPERKIKGINLKGLESGSTIELSPDSFITTQWQGISKIIKEGGIEEKYYNRLQVKKLSRKYEKGIVKRNGEVLPIKL